MVFFNIFFKTLGFFSALIVLLIIINLLVYLIPDSRKSDFVYKQGDKNSENIIAVLNLNGPIINSANLLNKNIFNLIDPKYLKNSVNELLELKPKILIIKINSPGGTVSATYEAAEIIKNYKSKSETIIYFVTENVLTSGAYWLANAGDKIYASYGSIIGSIGVSGPSWYYYDNPTSISSGLFGQTITTNNGIKIFNQNSGNSKDLFNSFRKPTKQELEHLQSMVDEIYDKFVNFVSKSRKIEKNYIKNEIGALVYTSIQAKQMYLIDGILNYENLISEIVKINKYESFKIMEKTQQKKFFQEYFLNYFSNHYNHDEKICNKISSNFSTIFPNYFNTC